MICKRKVFCLLLYFFVFCQVCFGAVISDHDGGAFVTKAEFEALKYDFHNQVEKYNESLDYKIDGAIGSYLSGLKLSTSKAIDSLIYNANQLKSVRFVRDWQAPTTKITNRYKHGGILVYVARGASKTASNLSFDGFGQIQVKAYENDNGRYGIYMTEENSSMDPSVIAKYYSNDGKPFLMNTDIYKVIPWATFDGATVTCSSNWQINCYSGSTVSYECSGGADIDYSLKQFGASTGYSAKIKINGGGETGNVTIPMVYSCGTDESNIIVNSSDYYNYKLQNLEYLAGNGIAQSENIVCVENNNWQKTYSTPFTIFNGFLYQGNANGVQKISGTINSFGRGSGYEGFSVNGSLEYPIYNKNYETKPATSFYKKEYCDATNKDVKYYTGIPLFELGDEADYDVNVTLNFLSSSITNGGKFSIRSEPFSNSNLQESNVTITKSNTDDSAFTDFDILPSSGTVTKSFCLKANKNKTYWLKVSPSADNVITVTSPDSFMATSSFEGGGGSSTSKMLYKFGVISDTHVDYDTIAQNNCKYLLNKMKNDYSVSFVVSCGDQTENGSSAGWNVWKQVVNGSDISINDVYECVGNHEVYGGVDVGTQRFIENARNGTLSSAYYSFDKFGDRFIIAAQESLGTNYSLDCFSTTQLNWIRDQISTYTGNGKIILIFHQAFQGWGSGDIPTAPVYTGNLKTSPATSYSGNIAFKQILIDNPDMITFHGHTHISLKEINKGIGFVGYAPPGVDSGGCHNFHCPGSRNMKEYNSNGTILNNIRGDGVCEGWIVERYSDKTILTAINGKSGEIVYGPITIY